MLVVHGDDVRARVHRGGVGVGVVDGDEDEANCIQNGGRFSAGGYWEKSEDDVSCGEFCEGRV